MALVIDGLTQINIPEQKQLENGSGTFPLTLAPSDGMTMSASQLGEWTKKHTVKLRELAQRHGAVLLRGCSVRGAQDFAAMSGAMDCEGYDYIGGAAPRTELVPGLVFTSNESPPDQPIPFHHELAQAPEPPSYILFHCETASAQGGATPIIHSEEVANFFEATYPDFASRVAALGVRYIRVMPEETDPSSAQGRSWKETYNVSTREEAEAAMRRQGTEFEWLSNGDCRTITATLPALRIDARTGKRVFFNSMIAAFIGWNDSRNVGEKAVVLGDGSPVDPVAMRGVADFMQQHRVVFKWHQGDILLIDNTLVMHARDTFVPPRRVLASLRGLPMPQPARPADGLFSSAGVPPLRMGIVGTGAMGKEHIRNIELLGEDVAVVSAVADSDARARREALEELGAKSSGCKVFERYADLLSCDQVDAVVVCTPNFQHIEVLRLAIPTGKHILCEKPLCTTVQDCEEVERLLDEHASVRGIFMTGMEYRWMPPIQRLIRETDSGSLGPLHTVTIREHRFPFLVKVDNWNRFNRYTGGTLVEKACHFFDLMRRIVCSEPVTVFATGGQAMNHKDEIFEDGQPDIIDHAFVSVEFASGAKAMLDLCMFAEDEQTEQVTAVCELGKVEARAPESTVRVLRRRHIRGLGRTPPAPSERGVAEMHSMPVPKDLAKAGYHEGATFFELREFVAAAQGRQEVPISALDGKVAVMIGTAAQESIRTGKVVRLDSMGPQKRHDAQQQYALETSMGLQVETSLTPQLNPDCDVQQA
eukprot:CAMPEP_0115219206 /NCGR_PEP_ID=MMETSP0270-20121206/26793_1 /TAXON_ID=71861 /ORGANISM="Scrippsiella trochoidea, Strain CCMP3099" /LENGTH=761 /DNA_ID=CAMNT_0002633185 /DNA_START=70 /DNA_END=2356 /DNA_ORIENTATION=+